MFLQTYLIIATQKYFFRLLFNILLGQSLKILCKHHLRRTSNIYHTEPVEGVIQLLTPASGSNLLMQSKYIV